VEYTGEPKPLKWGLANSRNNCSAWIMKQAKQPEAVADFLHNMGIRSFIDPVYALCLGSSEVSLFEMTGAFATFANHGVNIEPIFVTRIEARQGNLLASFVPTSNDAVSEETAHTMRGMLQNVINAGTGGRLRWQYGFRGEMGGKTGTSQENRDAWFIGVTPKLVAGVWVGGEDQSVHLSSRGEGSVVALPIFGEFLRKVQQNGSLGVTVEDTFYRPAGAKEYECWDGSITIEDVEGEEGAEGTEEDMEVIDRTSDVIFEDDEEFF
jgi:penicillin-binding protein 1A